MKDTTTPHASHASAALPARLTGLQAARARFGDRADRMAAFYGQGDPRADRALRALEAFEPARARALWDAAVTQGTAAAGLPSELLELLEQVEHVPFWVRHARCDRGGAAFFRTGALGGLVLGFGALARSYASSGGNKPLTFTGDLLARTPQRLAQTADFLRTVSAPGAMRKGGDGLRAILQVRMLHARVRKGLQHDSRWRAELWGVPINQADSAVTCLLFSSSIARGVRALGGTFSAEQEADLLHLWRYAGYAMGVDPELLCADVDEASAMAELVDVLDDGPDDDSRRLLAALLSTERLAERMGERRAQALYRMHAAVCHRLLGSKLAEALGVPFHPLDGALLGLTRPLIHGLSRAFDAAAPPGTNAGRAREARGALGWQRFVDTVPGAARYSHSSSAG